MVTFVHAFLRRHSRFWVATHGVARAPSVATLPQDAAAAPYVITPSRSPPVLHFLGGCYNIPFCTAALLPVTACRYHHILLHRSTGFLPCLPMILDCYNPTLPVKCISRLRFGAATVLRYLLLQVRLLQRLPLHSPGYRFRIAVTHRRYAYRQVLLAFCYQVAACLLRLPVRRTPAAAHILIPTLPLPLPHRSFRNSARTPGRDSAPLNAGHRRYAPPFTPTVPPYSPPLE